MISLENCHLHCDEKKLERESRKKIHSDEDVHSVVVLLCGSQYTNISNKAAINRDDVVCGACVMCKQFWKRRNLRRG